MNTKFETAISLIEQEEDTLNIFRFLLEDIVNTNSKLFSVNDDKLVTNNGVEKKARGYLFQAIENMQMEVLAEAMSVYKRQLVDACCEAEGEANEVLNRIRKSDKNI